MTLSCSPHAIVIGQGFPTSGLIGPFRPIRGEKLRQYSGPAQRSHRMEHLVAGHAIAMLHGLRVQRTPHGGESKEGAQQWNEERHQGVNDAKRSRHCLVVSIVPPRAGRRKGGHGRGDISSRKFKRDPAAERIADDMRANNPAPREVLRQSVDDAVDIRLAVLRPGLSPQMPRQCRRVNTMPSFKHRNHGPPDAPGAADAV